MERDGLNPMIRLSLKCLVLRKMVLNITGCQGEPVADRPDQVGFTRSVFSYDSPVFTLFNLPGSGRENNIVLMPDGNMVYF